MNTRQTTAALAALLLGGSVWADQAPAPAPAPTESVMTFFRHLKESLSQSAVRRERKKNRVGSVAAVRGADQSSSLADPDEPTLKGDVRSRRLKAAAAEDAEFAKGVDLILAGKTAEGVQALEAFKAKHPKSRSLDQVKMALDRAQSLDADKAAAPPAAPKPEPAKD